MSTRCNILIKGHWTNKTICLYHHHDGYPEGVGEDLRKRVIKFSQECKNFIKGYALTFINELLNDKEDEYELTFDIHGDIDYLYFLDWKTLTLRCYEVRDWDMPKSKIMKKENLVQVWKLKKEVLKAYVDAVKNNPLL